MKSERFKTLLYTGTILLSHSHRKEHSLQNPSPNNHTILRVASRNISNVLYLLCVYIVTITKGKNTNLLKEERTEKC